MIILLNIIALYINNKPMYTKNVNKKNVIYFSIYLFLQLKIKNNNILLNNFLLFNEN